MAELFLLVSTQRSILIIGNFGSCNITVCVVLEISRLTTTCRVLTGSVQQREAAVQVFPPTSASQGSAIDQRSQPFGIEERADAADDHGGQPADRTRSSSHGGGEF